MSRRRDITDHKRMPRHVLAMRSSRDLSVMSEAYGTSSARSGSGHLGGMRVGSIGEADALFGLWFWSSAVAQAESLLWSDTFVRFFVDAEAL